MMKLSEAIRVGSKLRAASERGWSDLGPDGQLRTCALSAAAEGAGLFTMIGMTTIPGPNWLKPVEEDGVVRDESQTTGVRSRVPDEWVAVTSRKEVPPCHCGERFYILDTVMTLVWHLHDMHGWSREATAEWIETIEKRIEAIAAAREAHRLEIVKEMQVDS